MRTLLLAGALSLCVVSGACVSAPSGDSAQAVGQTVVVRGTQALITAEYAYNTIGTIVLSMLQSGTIKGADATKVRSINAKVTDALRQGKSAQTDADRARAAAVIMTSVNELHTLSGR